MSKLSVGIVGLPNVGKSTLFKALTNVDINIANYPFATIDPNVGIVSVPDERLTKLAELSKSEKTIPAVVEFYDIAGLVRGANQGEGLGNQFLSHIREVSIVVHVVRAFRSEEIIHVEGSVDPSRDMETINTELILKDIDTMDKRIARGIKEAKTGEKGRAEELKKLEQVKTALDAGRLAISLGEELMNEPVIKEMGLLTSKPQIILVNGSEGDLDEKFINDVKSLGFQYVVADLGGEAVLDMLIRQAYATLDLITFFTTGPKETRGWTVHSGSGAPVAAGVIHTDFQNKFIRAEVINWEKLLEASSWGDARTKGWIRTEGKTYIVQDGDVLVIHHS